MNVPKVVDAQLGPFLLQSAQFLFSSFFSSRSKNARFFAKLSVIYIKSKLLNYKNSKEFYILKSIIQEVNTFIFNYLFNSVIVEWFFPNNT